MRFALLVTLALAAFAHAQTFSNSTLIRIPASGSGPGSASPYPSNIVVSGLTQPVGDISVSLTGLSHTFPADIEILLVGPSGQSVVLMNNTGANCDINGIALTFADGAPSLSNDCIVPGTYSPTSLGVPSFTAPAPAGPYGNSLSQFAGTVANGTWSLYIIDDAFLDSGQIAGGWSITFTPSLVSYQGRLASNGNPVNTPGDFVFSLYSSATGGTAMATVALNNVSIQNGLFTVQLPFARSLFDTSPRWLEILVRNPAGTGFFTQLTPRQPLTSAPKALFANTAGLALAATNAQNATHADSATSASLAVHATTADSANLADLATAAERLDAPDGSPTGAVVVSNDGNVGIPIATAGNRLSVIGTSHFTDSIALGPNLLAARGGLLHISDGSSLAPPQPEAQLLVEGFGPAYINILTQNANEHGVTFGSPASGIHGGIYYTNSVGMDFTTGNNLSRMTINAAGNVGMGVGVSGGSIDAKLHIAGSAASNRPLKVDRTGSDGELIAFARDDSVIGNITVAGGVVSYNAFTGSHWAWLDAPPERGTLVSMTGDNRRARGADGEVVYGARVTAAPNDPACLGAYLAPLDADGSSLHQIMAVGNGEMWVVNTGRDIQPGDYLISSDMPGCAMLDDAARFPVGHIIARAGEPVRWLEVPRASDGVQRRLLSVFFENFERSPAPDATLQARVKSLEAQNAELNARLALIESTLAAAGAAPKGPDARR